MLFLIINVLYLVDNPCIYNFRWNTKNYYYYTIFGNNLLSLYTPVSNSGEPVTFVVETITNVNVQQRMLHVITVKGKDILKQYASLLKKYTEYTMMS